MPKENSVSAQLAKLEADKKALEKKTREIKDAAAMRLGKAIVEAGGLELDPKALKAFMKRVEDVGGLEAADALLKQAPASEQIAA